MDDDTTSLCAALFGLAGFEVLAAGDVGGEARLLVRTTADLVGYPTCRAVACAKDRRPKWMRDLPSVGGRWCRAAGNGSGRVGTVVSGADLDRAARGDRAAPGADRTRPTVGVHSG